MTNATVVPEHRVRDDRDAGVTLSVVIPNHNYAGFLGEAIGSVHSSLRPSDEVIVVDDGSTDNSVAIARKYEGVQVIEQQNAGQARAIMRGVREARGDVVVLLDSDDCATSGRLEWIADAFEDPTVVMAWHPLEIDDGSGRNRGICPVGPMASGRIEDDVLHGRVDAFALTSGLAIRRSVMQELDPVPPEFRDAIDAYLVRAVPFHGRVASTSVPLGSYRVHRHSWSRSVAVSTGLLPLLDRRLSMARSERLLVGRLQMSRHGGGAMSAPAVDATFVDLALARARLASDGRQGYWSRVRTLERPSTDGWRRNLWFPLAVAFYGVLPIAFVRSLVEVKLTATDHGGAQRLLAIGYWRLVFVRGILRRRRASNA